MTVKNLNRKKVLFNYPELPEIKLCYFVTISGIIYAWWCVYSASTKFKFTLGHHASIVNLPYFGKRFRDETNWEWVRWSPQALTYLPFFIIHAIFFNVGEKFLPKNVWVYGTILISMASSAYIFTIKLVVISILQGTFVFLITHYYRTKFAVWISTLPILYAVMNHTTWIDSDPFLILMFVSYTLLSYVSFNLDRVRKNVPNEDKGPIYLYTRMIFYTFYPPYVVSMVVLYSDFERQLKEREIKSKNWTHIIVYGLRIAFWWFVAEAILYFLYFEAMLSDTRFASTLPKNELVSLGMAMGSFFHLKYVVIFGLQALFAKIDNMQPYQGPICIQRVALYSKIWRGFDRGLYAFFKEYIFIPICWPTFSLQRKIFGVLLSYAFVLTWHGFSHHNIVWIILNIVELFIEYGAKSLYTIKTVKKWREKHISDVSFRRILGWLQIIPFAFGLYSNFYFLGGSEVGWLFVQRIFWEETVFVRWPFLLLISLGYFYMQVTMEVERKQGIYTNPIEENKKKM